MKHIGNIILEDNSEKEEKIANKIPTVFLSQILKFPQIRKLINNSAGLQSKDFF